MPEHSLWAWCLSDVYRRIVPVGPRRRREVGLRPLYDGPAKWCALAVAAEVLSSTSHEVSADALAGVVVIERKAGAGCAIERQARAARVYDISTRPLCAPRGCDAP